jgi:alkanesulfonate monooxygenase SsuD/methylene tetrahydromethanopterin reductase-like flavin-dependent oxidoreductase (luciferase family)
MAALSDEIDTLKFVHTYGVGLHSSEIDPDVHDPRWQRRQVDEFVDFVVLAEELGFDGITVTEHHAPLMTCPSPHLLLAAAAVRTNRIRLGTAVTVLPLYHPLRVAEEAGMLDLLSGGRFELGLGRGIPGEALIALGRDLGPDELKRAWIEGLELVNLALSGTSRSTGSSSRSHGPRRSRPDRSRTGFPCGWAGPARRRWDSPPRTAGTPCATSAATRSTGTRWSTTSR